MKNNFKFILLFFLLFAFSGCEIIINYGNSIIPDSNEEIIPDEQYSYTPFQNLDPLVNEIDFEDYYVASNYLQIVEEYEENYGYRMDASYTIGASYYSTVYDTLYLSYTKDIDDNMSSYDLYLVERHAIAYFISDEIRSEDLNYLKAVFFYPDDSSSCGGSGVSGCASYGGKYGVINMNSTYSMERFLNPLQQGMYSYEPKRDTFAHEYGHVSTFYYLSYKGDTSYEEYLNLRLTDSYDTVYPLGLPNSYSSDPALYKIQPEEIMADDFVELFYYRDSKYEGDESNYVLKYSDYRNSLSQYDESLTYLYKDYNKSLIYDDLYSYYTNNFYNIERNSIEPVAIYHKTNQTIIEYYDSITSLNDEDKLISITSLFNVKLIAVEEVVRDNITYYRVVLSPLSNVENVTVGEQTYKTFDKKSVSHKMGYVRKDNYNQDITTTIYKVAYGWSEENVWADLMQESLLPVVIDGQNSSNLDIYVTPFYDFAYVISLGTSGNSYYMYDFLREECSTTQKFLIPQGSLLAL